MRKGGGSPFRTRIVAGRGGGVSSRWAARAGARAPARAAGRAEQVRAARAALSNLPYSSAQGAQATSTPFVKLKVLGVQKAAALRYHAW